MTDRLPVLSGRQVIRALERGGFEVVHPKGSHHILRHSNDRSRRTVVPVHGKEDLRRGLLRQILSDVRLSVDEFLELL